MSRKAMDWEMVLMAEHERTYPICLVGGIRWCRWPNGKGVPNKGCIDGPLVGASLPDESASVPDSSQMPFDEIEKVCRKKGRFLRESNNVWLGGIKARISVLAIVSQAAPRVAISISACPNADDRPCIPLP